MSWVKSLSVLTVIVLMIGCQTVSEKPDTNPDSNESLKKESSASAPESEDSSRLMYVFDRSGNADSGYYLRFKSRENSEKSSNNTLEFSE